MSFFRGWENIRQLQKKSMLNETASQEKQFKHIFRIEMRISQTTNHGIQWYTMVYNLSAFLTN